MSDEQRAECERAAAEATKARATVTAACSADLKQATLSTFTSVVQIGALKYARNLWSLARSEAAWTNPAVTNSAVANFSLLPGATAMGKGVARQGGTANPFDGNAAVAYEFFSGLPVVGAGLKLGEAINSCIAAGSATP